jgi:hypothetical protein
LESDITFNLPHGYMDATGQVQRQGRMRLATALDEIESVQDPRVQSNEAYLPVVLLSRVIIQLGDISPVPQVIIEQLYVSDLAYLEDLYLRLNAYDRVLVGAVCPNCSKAFQMQVAPLEVG